MYLNKYNPTAVHVITCITWAVLLAALSGCKATAKPTGSKPVRALQLFTSLPVLNSEENLVYYKNTTTLYEQGRYLIYEIPVTHNISRTTVNSEGETIGDTLLETKVKYRYFIYELNATQGMLYDSINAVVGQKQQVDSFLSGSTIRNFEKFYSKKWANDSLIKHYWNNDNRLLTEVYVPKIKKNNSYSDTTIMYYRRDLDSFNFYLFRALDSIKSIKLAGVVIKYNAKPELTDYYTSLSREIIFDVQPIQVREAEAIVNLIQIFQKKFTD